MIGKRAMAVVDRDWSRMAIRGVAFNGAYQALNVLVALGMMLVLARIIPPAEYGRVGVVIAWLGLLNTFNCATFMAQALQLPEDCEPDWSTHFIVGCYIQGILWAACYLLGVGFASWAAYREIAGLLRVGSFGFLLDCPNQLGVTMLRREMDFRTFRLIHAFGTISAASTTVTLGLLGYGAYAIVIGNNVISALPFGIYLFFVRRWHPGKGCWRWLGLNTCKPVLRFGLQRLGSGLLYSGRGALEAAVLQIAVGYTGIGFWNRAQALFSTSIGRMGTVVTESVYPLLPRFAHDGDRYARQTTLYLQVMLWTVVPGSFFVGFSAPAVSRLLYGSKWVAADPLLWPAALIGCGMLVFTTCSSILLAVNRLALCLTLDALLVCLSLPTLFIAWKSGNLSAYAWALTAAQMVASVITLACASKYLQRGWLRSILFPPLVASLGAIPSMFVAGWGTGSWYPSVRLLTSATAFGLVVVFIYRALFPHLLARILDRIPSSHSMRRWFWLPMLSQSPTEAN